MTSYTAEELTKGDLHFGSPQSKQMVILIPGLKREADTLSFLAQRLAESGYYCCILNHPSARQTIQESADFCRAKLDVYNFHRSDKYKFDKIHFVGSSRGGIVLRKMVKFFRPTNIGRAVCLGTPFKGSAVSNYFLASSILGYFALRQYGPSIRELQTGPEGIDKLFKNCPPRLPSHLEWGMIAGILPEHRKNERPTPLHPLTSPLQWPHDGTSSVGSTEIDGLGDHIILDGTGHRELEVDHDTPRLCHQFFEAGKFTPLPEPREINIIHRPPSPVPLHIRLLARFIAPKA